MMTQCLEQKDYQDENLIELYRADKGRAKAFWNVVEDKWEKFRGSDTNKSLREPCLRFYEVNEALSTFDMPLNQRNGCIDVELSPLTAMYFVVGYKENDRFTEFMTSRTIMRQF